MFLIITHIAHTYLHTIYKMPQIQLSTTSSPAHQAMPITDNTNRCKDKIMNMQRLMIRWEKKYKGLIKPQFLLINDRNHP